MARIKLCGIQSDADLDIINEAAPDYIGFVFAKSKRQVTISLAKRLIAKTKIPCVGVFVNEELATVAEIVKETACDIIQLHGDEDASYLQELKKRTGCEIWKALRIQSVDDCEVMHTMQADRYLIDSFTPDQYGGSGKRIHMDIIKQIDVSELIIAGGIASEHVAELLALHPYGIDVSSSIETDGRKDKEKVHILMDKLRNGRKS